MLAVGTTGNISLGPRVIGNRRQGGTGDRERLKERVPNGRSSLHNVSYTGRNPELGFDLIEPMSLVHSSRVGVHFLLIYLPFVSIKVVRELTLTHRAKELRKD